MALYSREAEDFATELQQSREQVLSAIEAEDRQYEELENHIGYGSGGFQGHSDVMKKVCFRVGLIVAMRAKSVGTCGIMVTGSHLPPEMNGVKLIEPDGRPLVNDWELISEMIVNSKDLDYSLKNLNQLTIKGFPTMTNLFGVSAIPSPTATAETLEQMEESKLEVPELEFPHVIIG